MKHTRKKHEMYISSHSVKDTARYGHLLELFRSIVDGIYFTPRMSIDNETNANTPSTTSCL